MDSENSERGGLEAAYRAIRDQGGYTRGFSQMAKAIENIQKPDIGEGMTLFERDATELAARVTKFAKELREALERLNLEGVEAGMILEDTVYDERDGEWSSAFAMRTNAGFELRPVGGGDPLEGWSVDLSWKQLAVLMALAPPDTREKLGGEDPEELRGLVRDMLDEAISYSEFILPMRTIEKLAMAINYKLPDQED